MAFVRSLARATVNSQEPEHAKCNADVYWWAGKEPMERLIFVLAHSHPLFYFIFIIYLFLVLLLWSCRCCVFKMLLKKVHLSAVYPKMCFSLSLALCVSDFTSATIKESSWEVTKEQQKMSHDKGSTIQQSFEFVQKDTQRPKDKTYFISRDLCSIKMLKFVALHFSWIKLRNI